MTLDVKTRISQSAEAFRAIVWPHFAEPLGGGELVPVETVASSEFATLLDTLGMTDAWQVIPYRGMRALATRIQWGPKNWESWTVRCELPSGNPTEWHKLTQYGPWQLPHFVIQAYIHDGRLLGAACIQTRDLQVMLINGWHGEARRNPQDGNLFYPVFWDRAIVEGFSVIKSL